LVRDPRFVSFVYETPSGIGAFLAGSTDTGAMLRATADAGRAGAGDSGRSLPSVRR
jgi:hypothetical protein